MTVLTLLMQKRLRWLVTGAAGFIGSHLSEELLRAGQDVVGLDNLSSGKQKNLDAIAAVDAEHRFTFIRGDIVNFDDCRKACAGADVVLHHAALVSVPLSIDEPVKTREVNIDGFANMLNAAREAGVKRFVYASSSAVYGDDEAPTKKEGIIGRPLSPYAASKHINEILAQTSFVVYGLPCVGLRYFNVFGPRQDPNGAYAAVIPRWLAVFAAGGIPEIYGDGGNTRDFCYVKDVMMANILAATTDNKAAFGEVFNVGHGVATSLNELFALIAAVVGKNDVKPLYKPFRKGDIIHSLANTDKIREVLGFRPAYDLNRGLQELLAAQMAAEI